MKRLFFKHYGGLYNHAGSIKLELS
jgi:hypothetical protein